MKTQFKTVIILPFLLFVGCSNDNSSKTVKEVIEQAIGASQDEKITKDFEISKIKSKGFKIAKDATFDGYVDILFYKVEGDIINKSNKPIVFTYLTAEFNALFADGTLMTVSGLACADLSFTEGKKSVSTKKPWEPNTIRSFKIETGRGGLAIDKIYLNYEPKKVTLSIIIDAEDPLSYKVDNGIIATYDLTEEWKNFQGSNAKK